MVLGSLKLAAVIYHCQNKREKLFFIFIAFMGGVGGPLLALLQMIIPIVPWLHIFG